MQKRMQMQKKIMMQIVMMMIMMMMMMIVRAVQMKYRTDKEVANPNSFKYCHYH